MPDTIPTNTLSSKLITDVLTAVNDKDASKKIQGFQLSGNCRQAVEVMRLESMRTKIQLSPYGISAEEYKSASEKLHYEITILSHFITLSDTNIARANNNLKS